MKTGLKGLHFILSRLNLDKPRISIVYDPKLQQFVGQVKFEGLTLLLVLLGVLPAVQGDRKCIKPKGNAGESYTEDCLKKTCKAGVWRSSLDASLCCYNRQPYLPNTTITATEDGCARASVYCTQEDDVTTVSLQVENTCGEHSTKEQVQELKYLLVEYLEQTDCAKDSPASTSSKTTTPTNGLEGILVSGGSGGEMALESVELFIPETGKTCSLTDLPAGRHSHTMNMVGDDLVVCGGKDDHHYSPIKSCLHLSPPSSSAWTSYTNTSQDRSSHTGWVSPSGELLLVGGDYSPQDAEIVSAESSTGREIRLEQNAYGFCGIDVEDSIILTGGFDTRRKVSRYNLQGHVENLPDMTWGRSRHGCSSYLSDGTMIIMVAGGYVTYGDVLSSSERMTIGASAWTPVPALPRALHGLALLTAGNMVYLTGGRDEDNSVRAEILVLDGEDWREVGQLQRARNGHAATIIGTASFLEFCS